MTRQPDGERIAVLETKIEALSEHMRQQHLEQSALLNRVIDGQQSGVTDRAAIRKDITSLKDDIAAMKPHTETIATAKSLWKAILLLATMAGTIAGAVGVGWTYIKPYLVWLFHTKG